MSDNKNVLIEVRDLCKSFDHVKVLNGISTTISQGEVVAIIGPVPFFLRERILRILPLTSIKCVRKSEWCFSSLISFPTIP